MNQISSTALSNGTSSIEERLARWLLMAHDRLDDDSIPLTHEFLSLMLGVRRAGAAVALNALERKGVISLTRGKILITDREGLKASANGSYADWKCRSLTRLEGVGCKDDATSGPEKCRFSDRYNMRYASKRPAAGRPS